MWECKCGNKLDSSSVRCGQCGYTLPTLEEKIEALEKRIERLEHN